MGLLDGKRLLVTGVLTDTSIAFHVARHGSGGVASLDGLLERHASVQERLAILQHGARGLLSLAESKPTSSAGAPTG